MVKNKFKLFSVFLLVGLFLIGIASAGMFDFANSKGVIKGDEFNIGEKTLFRSETIKEYPVIEIKSWLGLGKTKLSGAIVEHTSKCGANCYSELEIYLGDESPLIENIRFAGNQPREYKVYTQVGIREVIVDDVRYICENRTGEIIPEGDGFKGMKPEIVEWEFCENVVVGEKTEIIPVWERYEIGSNKPQGNYRVRVEGVKGLMDKVDWQIKTQGKWLNEWALWDEDLVAYYSSDDSNSYPDETGTYPDGDVYGAVYTSDGKIKGAYSFDGDDYIDIGEIDYVSKSYWRYNGTDWKNIVVTPSGTYVNGELACSSDMAYIDKLGGYCIDRWEASRSDATSGSAGSSSVATSRPNVIPWVSISQIDAITMCSNVGKHLCSDDEWLGAANILGQIYYLPTDLSVAPYGCNTNSKCGSTACPTLVNESCSSVEGVYDMVGNVWEWTSNVVDTDFPAGTGTSNGYRYLSTSGSFQSSTDSTTLKYGNDGVYFYSSKAGRAVRRGGGWSTGADAGPFCTLLNSAPDVSSSLIGFRCCSAL